MKKLFLLFVSAVLSLSAAAQSNESLNLVVTLPAGSGSGDVIARQWVKKYDEIFGTTRTVINKPGGDGVIGFKYFASLKDTKNSIPVMWPALGHVLSYHDTDKDDYEPVIELFRAPWVLVARKDFPANTFNEYMAYARANPGVVNTGMAPAVWIGMIRHINKQNNVSINFIPYDTTRPVLDVLNGTLDSAWVGLGSIIGTGLEPRVKILAVTSRAPLKDYPHIETGANPAIGEWYFLGGLFVHSSLPKETKEKLFQRFKFIRDLPWAQELAVKTHTEVPKHYSRDDYAKDIKNLKIRFDKANQDAPKK